jgi:hypothetical protein
MILSAFRDEPTTITEILVAITYTVLVWRLLKYRTSLDVITWWPLFLYVPGPLSIHYLFSVNGLFTDFYSEESILAATAILLAAFLLYVAVLSKPVSRQIVLELDFIQSSAFASGANWPHYVLGTICVGAQVAVIKATGSSLLNGEYILGQGAFAEHTNLFVAAYALYEIFAGLGTLKLISLKGGFKQNRAFLIWFSLVMLVRVIGGSRLGLLKAVLFTLFVRLCQGRLAVKKVFLYACAFAVALTFVGFLRSGTSERQDLTASFLFFAEGALSNLSATLVTDDALNHGVILNSATVLNALSFMGFIAIHLIPNFIYEAFGGQRILLGEWGSYRSWGEPLYPFKELLTSTGLDVVSPLGGQSIVALGVALFGVAGASLILVYVYSLFYFAGRALFRFAPITLILGFEAPSIYREPTEGLVKEVFIIAIGFAIFQWLATHSAQLALQFRGEKVEGTAQ